MFISWVWNTLLNKKHETSKRKGGGVFLDWDIFFATLLGDNYSFYYGRITVVESKNEKGWKSTTTPHH